MVINRALKKVIALSRLAVVVFSPLLPFVMRPKPPLPNRHAPGQPIVSFLTEFTQNLSVLPIEFLFFVRTQKNIFTELCILACYAFITSVALATILYQGKKIRHI